MSSAVELMLAHVENLRRQHDKNVADLEETKKLIQQQSTMSPKACSGTRHYRLQGCFIGHLQCVTDQRFFKNYSRSGGQRQQDEEFSAGIRVFHIIQMTF